MTPIWAALAAYLGGIVTGVVIALWMVSAVDKISAQVRRDLDDR